MPSVREQNRWYGYFMTPTPRWATPPFCIGCPSFIGWVCAGLLDFLVWFVVNARSQVSYAPRFWKLYSIFNAIHSPVFSGVVYCIACAPRWATPPFCAGFIYPAVFYCLIFLVFLVWLVVNARSQVSYAPVLYRLSEFCCLCLCMVARFLGVARGKRALPGELRPQIACLFSFLA